VLGPFPNLHITRGREAVTLPADDSSEVPPAQLREVIQAHAFPSLSTGIEQAELLAREVTEQQLGTIE
jgi:hypothetical protein